MRTAWVIRKTTVFADHGLTRHNIAGQSGVDSDDPGGFLGSDILNHGLTQLAPPVTWTTGSNGSLQPTSFTHAHFVIGMDRGADAEQLTLALDRTEGRAWGVHGTEFFWRPKGSGRKWKLRRSQVSFSEENEGEDSAYNGVIVYYRDPAGSSLSTPDCPAML